MPKESVFRRRKRKKPVAPGSTKSDWRAGAATASASQIALWIPLIGGLRKSTPMSP
jgi:hypothetical protein